MSLHARTLALSLALMGGGCDCSDGGLTQLRRLIIVDVERLAFADTFVGGSRTLTVTLTSAGTAPVSLREARIVDDATVPAFTITSELPDQLVAGASIDVSVRFAPLAAGVVAGTLTIETDAENTREVQTALDGSGLAPLDCDDDNPCTDEIFDATAGACVRANRTGPCDDASVCTDSDRCDEGTCVGDARTCADDVECTLDVCDPLQGCLFVPQNAVCADTDPCTLDVCDPSAGCANPPAPDGTLCGSIVECQSLHVCILQQCSELAIPEGTPCSDGDVCTSGDVCAAGQCVGTVSDVPPSLVAESSRLMPPASALLVQGRVVALDDVVKVLTLDGSAPPVVNARIHDVIAFTSDGTTAVLLRRRALVAGAPAIPFLDLYLVDPLDPLNAAASTPIGLAADQLFAFFATQGRAYACVDGPRLHVVDLVSRAVDVVNDAAAVDLVCNADLRPLAVSDGLALSPDRAPATPATQLRLLELAPAGPLLHPIDRPAGLSGTTTAAFLHAGLGALVTLGSTRVGLVDARDLAAITVATMDLPTGVVAVAVRAPFLYIDDATGIGRIDISDITAPLLDSWRAEAPSVLVGVIDAIDDEHLLVRRSTRALAVADLVVAGPPQPLPWQGSFGPVVAADDGHILTANRLSPTMLVSPFTDDGAVNEVFLLGPVILEAPNVVGLYAPVFAAPLNQFETETGPLDLTTVQRADRRASLQSALDPQVSAGRITFDDTGALTELGTGPAVAFPDAIDTLYAPAASSCIGAALGARNDTDCAFPGCAAELFVLSICSDGVDVVPLTSIAMPAFFSSDLPFIASTAHGELISFLGKETAALVNVTDPLQPTFINADIPELLGASFASAGADQSAWLVLIKSFAAAPRAILFDTSTGEAVRRAEWDLLGGAAADIRRRVLGVAWPRAFIADWTPSLEPYAGHRVDIYDLESVPPVVTDSITIASEPTGLAIQNDELVIVRSDGVSIISPPCGP